MDYEKNVGVEPEMVCQILAELDSKQGPEVKEDSSDSGSSIDKECIDFVSEKRAKNVGNSKQFPYEATPGVRVENQNVCFENDCFEKDEICLRSRLSSECYARFGGNSLQKRCYKGCLIGKLNEWKIGEGETVWIPTNISINLKNSALNHSFDDDKNECFNVCTCKNLVKSSEDHDEDNFEYNHDSGSVGLECDFYCLSNNFTIRPTVSSPPDESYLSYL